MIIPQEIKKTLKLYHQNGVTEKDCLACSSSCCSHGGFAILENIVKIYELYETDQLKRIDFNFKRGLNFEDFIYEYFDVFERNVSLDEDDEIILLFFHMKSIDEKGRLISIPGEDFWNIRTELFEQNPWLNKGYVFLSKQVANWGTTDDMDSSRHCILHQKSSLNEISAKPIDCLFFTCETPLEAKEPSEKETNDWFYKLAVSFPNSKERFEELISNQ